MTKATLLLADDDRLVLATLAEGLRRSGYTVLDAAGGEEAIRLAGEHRPDLAILDMRMPDRDGLAVARWLCEYTDCPFLFLSAYGDAEVVEAAVQSGALGYLVKPLDVQQILPSIEAALNRGRELRALLEEEAQLSAALRLGREISMAVGILMAREGLDEQAAFERLRSKARTQRRRLRALAAELVKNAGPGGPEPRPPG